MPQVPSRDLEWRQRVGEPSSSHGGDPHDRQRVAPLQGIGIVPGELEQLLAQPLHLVRVALVRRQPGRAPERPRPQTRWPAIERERLAQPATALRQVAVRPPELPQRHGRTERQLRVAGVDGPPQGRAEVVVVGLEAVVPDLLRGPTELRLRPFGHAREVVGVSSPEAVRLAELVATLRRVLAGDVEHRVPGVVARRHGEGQALVQEGREAPQHLAGAILPGHGLRRLERPPPGEDGERPEEGPLPSSSSSWLQAIVSASSALAGGGPAARRSAREAHARGGLAAPAGAGVAPEPRPARWPEAGRPGAGRSRPPPRRRRHRSRCPVARPRCAR